MTSFLRKNKIKLIILMLVSAALVSVGEAKAGVNDFKFSDFTGDYYLSKDAEGISHLKVKESVTAEFPEYKQNKGICRQIAFTNQNGTNVTLPNLTRNDIRVTRNGVSESIYSIEKEANYYNVCTGTEEYVMGKQTYVFEYEFERVVTDFSDFQELYWDTNGTGASQKFDKVTARLHFADEDVYTGKKWCYVGKYGEGGQDRCVISEISDGVEFVARNLGAYENLTFDVKLKPDSFVVPKPAKNYSYVWLTVALGVICLLAIAWGIRKFIGSRGKAKYYKGVFVKPEYQPNKDYTLPEMAEIYLGEKKDMKVAMLLELVVDKKIEFQKAERRKWNILVKDLRGIGVEYMSLLAILNSGSQPVEGSVIELKRNVASNRLVKLKKAMESRILSDLKKDGLVEENYIMGSSGKRGIGNIIVTSIVAIPLVLMVGVMLMGVLDKALGLDETYGQEMVFYGHFYSTALIMVVVTALVVVILIDVAEKCARHTNRGLVMSRYMDGLRLYIEMAEAERMKMLQSVKGVDVSPEGVVRLYEKLLPYAAVFGLEESWMSEMKEYCRVQEIEELDYLLHGIVAADMMRAVHNASNYVSMATTMANSSGGSGGGGGGFSGGGGGGGGFSGR